MGAKYSFYVKSIATCAPTFFGYIISVLASVSGEGWGEDYVLTRTLHRYNNRSKVSSHLVKILVKGKLL